MSVEGCGAEQSSHHGQGQMRFTLSPWTIGFQAEVYNSRRIGMQRLMAPEDLVYACADKQRDGHNQLEDFDES